MLFLILFPSDFRAIPYTYVNNMPVSIEKIGFVINAIPKFGLSEDVLKKWHEEIYSELKSNSLLQNLFLNSGFDLGKKFKNTLNYALSSEGINTLFTEYERYIKENNHNFLLLNPVMSMLKDSLKTSLGIPYDEKSENIPFEYPDSEEDEQGASYEEKSVGLNDSNNTLKHSFNFLDPDFE